MVNQNTDVVTTKLQEIQLLRWERFLFGGEGGLVICRWGDLGLGRRRRNGGGECRQGGHIFTFFDGLTDGFIPSVTPSLIVTGNRHVTAHTCFFKSLGDSIGIFWRCTCHVTHTDLAFKSIGESIGIFVGEPVTLPVQVPSFESVGDSVGNITRQNLHVSNPHFFLILNFPSVIQLVTTDRKCPLVVTDWITDGKSFVGNFNLKLPMSKIFRRWFRCY